MNNNLVQKANEWFLQKVKGLIGYEVENILLEGLQIVDAHEGFIRCSLVVPIHLTDKDGNWEVGAMISLMDSVAAVPVYSFSGHIKASVDFTVSCYSKAKFLEEVEIEAKVAGEMGRLTSVMVEVRRKDNGALIALGKQWTTVNSLNKNKVAQVSKL